MQKNFSRLNPKAVVLVATIRALRLHGGVDKDSYDIPNIEAVKKGFENLGKHIENILKYNITPVVAINSYITDSDEETNFIIEACSNLGIEAIPSKCWEFGGDGSIELAKAIAEKVESNNTPYTPLYNWNSSVKDKIKTIAKETYGATAVQYSSTAEQQLKKIEALGFNHFPICMAKTQKSFSDNEKLIGRPKGFKIKVREIEIAAGAQFIIPILGKILRMPGLPTIPASEKMTISDNGVISGLS